MPATSGRVGSGERVSGRRVRASHRPASPIGTFTRKMGRHRLPSRSAETSTPPSTCPTTAAIPPVAPNQPTARDRDDAVPVAWIVARVCGTISAAAAPCSTRAATSAGAVGARPQSRLVTVNAAIPATKSRRRPKASPRRPPTTSSTAYAVA